MYSSLRFHSLGASLGSILCNIRRFVACCSLILGWICLPLFPLPELNAGIANGDFEDAKNKAWKSEVFMGDIKTQAPPIILEKFGHLKSKGLSMGRQLNVPLKTAVKYAYVMQEFDCAETNPVKYCTVEFQAWYPAAADRDKVYAALFNMHTNNVTVGEIPDDDNVWGSYKLSVLGCGDRYQLFFIFESTNPLGPMTNLRIDNVTDECTDFDETNLELTDIEFPVPDCPTPVPNVPYEEPNLCIAAKVATSATSTLSTNVNVTVRICTEHTPLGTTETITNCCQAVIPTSCSIMASTCIEFDTRILCTECNLTTVTKCVSYDVTTTQTFSVQNCTEYRLPGTTATTTNCCDIEVTTQCTVRITTCVTFTVCTTSTMGQALLHSPEIPADRDMRNAALVNSKDASGLQAVRDPVTGLLNTTIEYRLDESAMVRINLFDSQGRKVQTIVQEVQDAGHYKVSLDTGGLSPGAYLYRLELNEQARDYPMLLVK